MSFPSVPSSGSGLQAERTGLAWTRTSLAVAANAALLVVREIHHVQSTRTEAATLVTVLVWAAVVLSTGIAIATAVYGRRRSARLREVPLPDPVAPGWVVPALGWSVVVLAVLSGLVVVL